MANIESVQHFKVAVQTAPTEVFAEDTVANFMLLQNYGTEDIYLSFEGDAVAAEGIWLAPSGTFLLDNVTIDQPLSAISGGSNPVEMLVTVG